MRFAAALLALVFVSASANSEVLVSLAIEPEVAAPETPTLQSAARANDFATFDALYRAKPDPAYRTLHELWTYAMTEPTGAWYGAETCGRLSREYPRFAESIEPYRIVDGKRNAFYPVSETRAFLLRSAEAAPPLSNRRANTKAEAVPPHSTPKRIALQSAPRKVGRVAPAQAQAPTPVIVPEPPAVIARPVFTTAPAPAPTPVQKATNRGLFLVIIGLVGIGVLALIVRAPREVIP